MAVGTAAALLAGCGGARRPEPRPAPTRAPLPVPANHRARRPNVVLVLTDDLSTDLLRFMPHVRALARRGTSFSRYVVSDSLCCPSRASILTGRLSHDTGVWGNVPPAGGWPVFHGRGEERRTFAVALHRAGYRTGFMGKYLNDYAQGRAGVPPGWDTWAGTDDGYREYDYVLDEQGHPVHYGDRPRDYLTAVLQRRADAFVDAARTDHRPFALEVSTFAPHRPAIPAPQDRHALTGLRAPRGPAFDRRNVDAPPWLAARVPLTARIERSIDRRYRRRARSVLAVDRLVGELGDRLRAEGLLADTDIVFSSDNGFHMGEHRLRPGKMTAFDSDVRVPLIVAGPDARPGRRVGALAQNTDLAPTFERLGGARVPRGTDGRSLLGLLHGAAAPRDWRRAALVEHHGPDFAVGDPDYQEPGSGNPPTYEAIRTPHLTYVEYVDGIRELYDDRRDPAQRVDVWALAPAAERRRLHAAVTRLAGCHGQACAAARRPRR